MKVFQDRLRQERENNHFTQRDMAEKIGITQPSYIRYENGKSEPTLENLVRIAEILDVSIDYLLGKSDF
ncbi:MAG: helix-turn-helix domain-containing protein [Christensenellales bacterium]